MNRLTKLISMTLAMPGLMIALQSTAFADDFYIGAGTYRSEAKITGFDDDDNTSAFILGYAFIDSAVIVAAELGRYDLGSYSNSSNDIEGDATTLAGVVSLALGPFIEVYAKAGIASVELDVNGQNFDDDETFSGFGIGWDILDTVDIYAEYLEFDTEVDSELIGVGIRLDF